jgi:hypothetical protein
VSAFGDYPYALKRYVNETRRLYRTMDRALAKSSSGYLVGDHLTIADIAIWPWATAYSKSSTPSKGDETKDEKFLASGYMQRILIQSALQNTVDSLRLTSSPTSKSGCTSFSRVLGSRRVAMCRVPTSTFSSTSFPTMN